MSLRPAVGKGFFPGLALGLIGLGAVALAVQFPSSCPPYRPEPGAGFHDDPAADARDPGTADGMSAAEPPVTSLLACGDILLARTPGKRAADHGFRYLFQGVRELVSSADLAFANLETPASYLGSPWPGKPPVVTFRADPATLFGLAWAGFDVVSLANNHMNDYGPRAVAETLEYLDLLDVARTGAGMSLEEARRPAVLTVGGETFVFLAYAEPIWSVREARPIAWREAPRRAEERLEGPVPEASPYGPDDGKGSPAGVVHATAERMLEDIRAVRDELSPDYLFVSVHWGDEHQHYPTPAQKALGRAAIDAGATAVLGHHPHVLQGVERYREGLIIYSMGNFVFDMAADSTYRTAAFRLYLSGGTVARLEVIPVTIERLVYAPSPAAGPEAASILSDLKRWSAYLGTELTVTGELGLLDFRR